MILKLKVKPSAKEDAVKKLEDGTLMVSVKAPPVDNKANERLIEILSKFLDIPKSRILIKAGNTSKHKLIEIL